jgi:hypothetical protein
MAFGLDSVIELACGTAAARQTTFTSVIVPLGDRRQCEHPAYAAALRRSF